MEEDAAILMDVLCGNTGDDNNSNLDAKYFDSSNNNSSSSGSPSSTAIVSKENLVDVAAPLKGKTFAVIKETLLD